jgi:hypothetical protein
MPCNASYARFIFGKFFTSTIILYILLFAQNFFFILAKSGCYNIPEGSVGHGRGRGQAPHVNHRHLHHVHQAALRICWPPRMSS